MGPRGLCIHVGGSCGSIFKANVHVILHFLDRIYLYLQQILDKDSFIRRFLELHSGLYIFSKQVMDLLVVDFDKTATDKMMLARVVLCNRNDLRECSGNDTLGFLRVWKTHHRVGFSATSLSVSKNSSIITVKHIVNQ